ncbi:endonuclease [Vibrio sp. 10N.261.55.A7]|uniref:endonuclease III domain-containing protein n=1 Tax=Vibrio sp. 10N.261.55.A7 TaxID=1880851 RepID=UPI000CAA41BF|nr:endonuclease [Vibrio sp. 10N.261.55.A7]PMJ96394.1 endonuclease [Vibrio sp. 10N.261.55.A7]
MIVSVFEQLERYYGRFDWWPSKDPYQIMVGAILVQNTNWKNAEKAIANLGDRLNPEVISAMPIEALAQSIRSSGYYNQKALKLKVMTEWYAGYEFDITQVKKQDLALLRKELLSIKGIGGETADVFLTYAIGKPSFVIDAYARRIFSRHGVVVPKSYDAFREMMQSAIPPDTDVYAYYHGLIVEHGQQFCRTNPLCAQCPLTHSCQKRS